MIEASANIGAQESGCVCSASYVCANNEIVLSKMVPTFLFYRHKEGRGTCTKRSKVVVFSPNRGRAVGNYCRKYTVGALKSMAPGMTVVLGVVFGLAEITPVSWQLQRAVRWFL